MSATAYDMEPGVVEDPAFTIGLRIRKARKDKGLEQADVADLVGVSRQLISKWERDVSLPDVAQAARLADALSVSFGWMCGVDVRSRWFASLALVSDERQPELPFGAATPDLALVP